LSASLRWTSSSAMIVPDPQTTGPETGFRAWSAAARSADQAGDDGRDGQQHGAVEALRVCPARAGNRRKGELNCQTPSTPIRKTSYKSDLLWETLRVLNHPGRAWTVGLEDCRNPAEEGKWDLRGGRRVQGVNSLSIAATATADRGRPEPRAVADEDPLSPRGVARPDCRLLVGRKVISLPCARVYLGVSLVIIHIKQTGRCEHHFTSLV
jgi:hypothetical protein